MFEKDPLYRKLFVPFVRLSLVDLPSANSIQCCLPLVSKVSILNYVGIINMRKVILYIAMSIDGYIAKNNGNVGWLVGDGSEPEASGSYPSFYETIDTVIMGWNTYRQIITELSPEKNPYEGKISYILTHKKKENKADTFFINDDIIEFIQTLKSQSGKNIWICGGASIAQQLIENNLIDEYHISIIPTLLGQGIKLFSDSSNEKQFRLIRTEEYNGIVDLVYEKR